MPPSQSPPAGADKIMQTSSAANSLTSRAAGEMRPVAHVASGISSPAGGSDDAASSNAVTAILVVGLLLGLLAMGGVISVRVGRRRGWLGGKRHGTHQCVATVESTAAAKASKGKKGSSGGIESAGSASGRAVAEPMGEKERLADAILERVARAAAAESTDAIELVQSGGANTADRAPPKTTKPQRQLKGPRREVSLD